VWYGVYTGKVLAPILLVNLDKTLESKGLHLVVPSFDGHSTSLIRCVDHACLHRMSWFFLLGRAVYVIDGRTGCTNKVDFGEKAYGKCYAANP